MNEKPSWMFYAREVREKLEAEAARRPKGPSRQYRNLVESSHRIAVRDHGYKGTADDWLYLMKYARLPGDTKPSPNLGKKWYHA